VLAGDTVPEPVGRWVEGRVVFTPPTTELEFYSALATYLQVCGSHTTIHADNPDIPARFRADQASALSEV
jgi:hypothetical protein